ncbi:MAG TPA: hypothetical protein VF826_08765 [Chloroflexia bacterium]
MSPTDTNQALTGISPAPLVLPERHSLKLVGGQIPEKATKGAPILLSYSDGSKNVSLTQVLGGIESQFIPAWGDSLDTREATSTTEHKLTVRGGKSASYTEARSGSHTRNSLQWQEGGWLIVVEAQDVNEDYMLGIAEALTQQQR